MRPTTKETQLLRAQVQLEEAARLVESATDCLNIDTHTCKHCDAVRRDDWNDYRAYALLRPIIDKLRKVASEFRDEACGANPAYQMMKQSEKGGVEND